MTKGAFRSRPPNPQAHRVNTYTPLTMKNAEYNQILRRLDSKQLLIMESNFWKKNQTYKNCVSYRFLPPNLNLILLEAKTTYVPITFKCFVGHHQFTLDLSQGHWQKLSCNEEAQGQCSEHSTSPIPGPVNGLWAAASHEPEPLGPDMPERRRGFLRPEHWSTEKGSQ